MSAVEKIKAAAAELNPDEQVELFRWWVESDTFKQRHLAVLKRKGVLSTEPNCGRSIKLVPPEKPMASQTSSEVAVPFIGQLTVGDN